VKKAKKAAVKKIEEEIEEDKPAPVAKKPVATAKKSKMTAPKKSTPKVVK
jgi:hypothetical protein